MKNKCPKPLTKEEIFCILEKAKFACLTVFNKENMCPIPVCFELKHCNDNLIIEVMAKEDPCALECLKDCDKVLLEVQVEEGEKCKDREKRIRTVFIIGVVTKDICEMEKQRWVNCERPNTVEICVLELFGREFCLRCPEFKCELVCIEEKEECEHKCENKCEHRNCNRDDRKDCKGGCNK